MVDKPHGNTGNKHAQKAPGEARDSIVHIRVLTRDKASWVRQASRERKKLSTWIVEKLNS